MAPSQGAVLPRFVPRISTQGKGKMGDGTPRHKWRLGLNFRLAAFLKGDQKKNAKKGPTLFPRKQMVGTERNREEGGDSVGGRNKVPPPLLRDFKSRTKKKPATPLGEHGGNTVRGGATTGPRRHVTEIQDRTCGEARQPGDLFPLRKKGREEHGESRIRAIWQSGGGGTARQR